MKWTLLRNLSLRARNHLLYSPTYRPNALPPCLLSSPARSPFRLFSSDNDSPPKEDPESAPQANLVPAQKKGISLDVQDVSNKGIFQIRTSHFPIELRNVTVKLIPTSSLYYVLVFDKVGRLAWLGEINSSNVKACRFSSNIRKCLKFIPFSFLPLFLEDSL